jgi:GT2 family glycosyltransferase
MQRFKEIMHRILSNPLVGRPLRKFFWILLISLQRLTGAVHTVFIQLPYVRNVDRMLAYARTHAMKHLDEVLRYYKTLEMDLTYLQKLPKISVIVPVYNPPIDYFRECLQSVAVQIYDNWELCIVDDCSTNPQVLEVIREFADRHGNKVKWAQNKVNSHISVTSNHCLELATGEYVALLDHDDRLYPSALAEVMRHINLFESPEVLYSDEQVIDADGNPSTVPFFKPDWSPQLHLRVNYTTHLSVYDRQLVQRIGGFRKGFEGSQDHDLMLRAVAATTKKVAHIPMVLYQWRAHAGSTAASIDSKPYAAQAGERCVTEYLKGQGRPAQVAWESETGHYRIQYELPKPAPLVSLVICTKDMPKLIGGCLDAIISKSTYSNFEIVVVDNQTTDPECLALFAKMEQQQQPPFRRVCFDKPFNFAAMNNLGVSQARGEFVVLLNNDTVVIEPRWIEELIQLAQFPEVGAVGAKLLYENGLIQHAGVALADRDVALHICLSLPPDDLHYMGMTCTVHEAAAVTGACLCIQKSKFEKLGGLKERFVANGYGDVEFCIRLMQAGFTNIFTPHASLFHYESPSRKASYEFFERNYLVQTYGQQILNDPYLNPNFHRGILYVATPQSMVFQLNDDAFQYVLWTDRKKWNADDFHEHKRKHRKIKMASLSGRSEPAPDSQKNLLKTNVTA